MKAKLTVAAILIGYLLLAIGDSFGQAFDAYWYLSDFTQTPQTNRPVTVTPVARFTTFSTNIITGDNIPRTTDAHGYFAISNMEPGRYIVDVLGTRAQTTFTNVFTNGTTGWVNAKDHPNIPTNIDGSTQAYSQNAADARFVNVTGDTMTGGLTNSVGIAGGNSILRLDTSSAFNTILNAGTGSAKLIAGTGGISLYDVAGSDRLDLFPSGIFLRSDVYAYSNLFGKSIIASNGFSGDVSGTSNYVQAGYANSGIVSSNDFKFLNSAKYKFQTRYTVPGLGYDSWHSGGSVGGGNATFNDYSNSLIVISNLNLVGMAGPQGFWIEITDGYQANSLDANGLITWDTTKFPAGLPALISLIHAYGCKTYVYTEPNTTTSGGHPGAGTNLIQNATNFAGWGFDGIRLDNVSVQDDYAKMRNCQVMYEAFASVATNKTLMFYNGSVYQSTNSAMFSGIWPGSITRIHTDLGGYITPGIDNATNYFTEDLMFRLTHMQPSAVGAGHWVVTEDCNNSIGGAAAFLARTDVGMYAMTVQPIHFTQLVGADPQYFVNADIYKLIQQDPLLIVAQQQRGNTNVWVKPLINGDVAIALLNPVTNSPSNIGFTWPSLGFSTNEFYTVHEVWSNIDIAVTSGPFTSSVPAMEAKILILKRSPFNNFSSQTTATNALLGMNGSNSMTFHTNGNIGMGGMLNPQTTLEINGTLRIDNGISSFSYDINRQGDSRLYFFANQGTVGGFGFYTAGFADKYLLLDATKASFGSGVLNVNLEGGNLNVAGLGTFTNGVTTSFLSFTTNRPYPSVTVNTNGAGAGATAIIITNTQTCDNDFVVQLICGPAVTAQMQLFTVTYGTAFTTTNYPVVNCISGTNRVLNTAIALAHVDGDSCSKTAFSYALTANTTGAASTTNFFHVLVFGK